MIQEIITYLIIAVAFGYTLLSIARSVFGLSIKGTKASSSACGSGCSSCQPVMTEKKNPKLIKLNDKWNYNP